MLTVLIPEPKKLEVADLPKPQITQPDEVLVRVLAGGICGSDLHIYHGTNPLATYPRVIGHEFGGVVEEGAIDVLYNAGIANELFPLLLFIGIGAAGGCFIPLAYHY